MSEAEALEIASTYLANCISAITLYMSFTFGFLSVAYFVGKKLRVLEMWIISVLYIFSAGTALMSFLNANRFYGSVLQYIPGYTSENPFSNPIFWEIAGSIFCVAGIFLSLFYMRNVRNSEEN